MNINAQKKAYKYGDIYKEITGEKSIPENPQKIWENLEKKGKIQIKAENYGSALTPIKGNVFKHENYDLNIDKYLK